MAESSSSTKIIIVAVLLFAAAAAGFGYFRQTSTLQGSSEAAEAQAHEHAEPVATVGPDDALFQAKPGEIVIGNADAPVTIIEYSSLSCPHCAHFHEETLPQLKKEYLDTGKAKLVMRHFPLNEPALRAAQVVECGDETQRMKLLQTLFANQKDWAFNPTFKDDLKRIAGVAGIDGAQFASCLNDAALEERILQVRQDGATKAGVNSTPSFLVDGHKMEGVDIDTFRAALKAPKSAE